MRWSLASVFTSSSADVEARFFSEESRNDGTGLLALQFGLLMLVTGRTLSSIEGVGRLVFLTAAVY